MPAGLDGDIKIGVDLKTKSASKAVESFRKKVRDGFGGQDAKGLEQTIKSTEKNIKSLEKEIEKTKSKIQDLMQSEIEPKSVKVMEKELQQTEKEIDKVVKQLDALAEERKAAEASRPTGFSNEVWAKMPEGKRSNDITGQMIPLNQELGELVSKSDELKAKLTQLKSNPQLTEEGKKYNRELDEASAELENQKKKLQELKKEQSAFNNSVGSSDVQFKGMQKNLRRVRELIKSAFFFSVITKGATLLRESIGKIVKQNTALQSSLNQIKGNLLTAFAPIWQTILPWLQAFLNMLAKVTGYIATFFNMLMGKSVKSSQAAAKALYEQANATEAAGKSAEEAGKASLSFDTLNTISKPAESGSGGGAGSASKPTFETTDVQISDELFERLKSILVLVGSIGVALLAWKIGDFVKTLATGGKEAEALMGKFKMVGGILMIIAGAILLVKDYSDAWVNGLDWGNFLGIIAGLALVIGGIALAINSTAAAFATVGAGIALIVLGIKDLIDNGPTLQNILMIIAGVATTVAGLLISIGKVGKLGSSFNKLIGPITLVAVGIAALVMGVVDFINNGPTLQNTILIIGGAIAIAVGLATAGLSVLVSIIIAAVAAAGAFVAAILLEKPAIMSVQEAQENLTAAKERAKDAENEYINAIDNAEAAERRLAEAEKAAGITGQELFEQVQSGTLDYKDMNDTQKELYKAYLDNEQKQKDLKIATEELTDAKKNETIASFENELAVAKEKGSYDEYKNSVVDAYKKGILSADEARELIGKSMSEMSDDAQKTFMEDLPDSIKDGLDPHQYESTKTKICKWFSGIWTSLVDAFKKAWDGALKWWKNLFGGESESKGADKSSTKKNTKTSTVKSSAALQSVSVSVPALAQGTVLPPNKPFAAIVGDQKRGTNIEAPLDTIVEAMLIALSKGDFGNGGDININFTGNLSQLARVLNPVIEREKKRGSTKLVKGGAY